MSKIDVDAVKGKLVDFIRKTVSGAGYRKVILGLSGGVDSGTVAYLSAEALGAENVVGVLMPYGKNDPESVKCADLVVEALKIKKYKVDISLMVDDYFKNFPDADKVRRGNKMARERMAVLYDLSKKENALVIGSGNKTETLLGYCTLFGDSAWALNPLANLYKAEVYMLAEHLGIPEPIIKRRPTAGLWNGQTDEDELGYSYGDIDRLLALMVDGKLRDEELKERGFSAEFINDIRERIKASDFKRRPPAVPKE